MKQVQVLRILSYLNLLLMQERQSTSLVHFLQPAGHLRQVLPERRNPAGQNGSLNYYGENYLVLSDSSGSISVKFYIELNNSAISSGISTSNDSTSVRLVKSMGGFLAN